MRLTLSLFRAFVLITLVAGLALPAATWASSVTTLKVVQAPGYVLGVSGRGWTLQRPIAVTLYAGGWTVGIQLRPAATGSFKVGVRNVSICGGLGFKAADTAGHRATVASARPLCPSPSNPPRPTLHVLQGKLVTYPVHRLVAPSGPTSVTMKLGERLYLWEPGTITPAFNASADPTYLALLDEYHTPPRMCPAADCAEGFVWTWTAVRPGTSLIDMSPACRLVHPPCGRPDFAIAVHITR